ncbi:MAG: AraC family transcriptional regulator [Oscillospiraceae bacterium]|nr:AraC family transcriptional regulator [Oscillospiraceae bacterium]
MKKQFLPAENAGYLNENYRLFHLRDMEGQERDYHFHEFDKLVLLIEGSVTYIVEDQTYTMQPWELLLVRHHSIHKAQIDVTKPYERVILYLDSRYFDRLMPEMDLGSCFERTYSASDGLIRPDSKQMEEILAAIEAYENTRDNEDPFTRMLSGTYMMQLLIAVSRAVHQAGKAGSTEKRVDSKISGLLSYINSHLEESLSVEQLAEQAYLSRSRLMHLFHEQTGETIHAYIRRKRLVQAMHRMRDGMLAAEAAASCGFRDYSAFYRAFRNEFGISPSEMLREDCKPTNKELS